jgi:hypothetical protein
MIFQCDFPEKFECTAQNDPQAAHFEKNKIIIFTAVQWHQNEITSSENVPQAKQSYLIFGSYV